MDLSTYLAEAGVVVVVVVDVVVVLVVVVVVVFVVLGIDLGAIAVECSL